jgi:hypothetical protein
VLLIFGYRGEDMAFDIPNYIALPVGVALSIGGSLLLMRYQDDISIYFSNTRQKKTLKKRSIAINRYLYIKRMREDPQYMYLSISKMTDTCHLSRYVTIIAAVMALIVSDNSDITSPKAMKYIWLLLVVIFFIDSIRKSIELYDVIDSLLQFDTFESEVKTAWPDAFSSGDAEESRLIR